MVGEDGRHDASRRGVVRMAQEMTLLVEHRQAEHLPVGAHARRVRPAPTRERELAVRAWLRVMLPGRPNGRTGWIRADRTRPSSTAWALRVDLSARPVTAYRCGVAQRRFRAVVGTPGMDRSSRALGSASSHGCVRPSAAAVTWLATRVGRGVRVTVVDERTGPTR